MIPQVVTRKIVRWICNSVWGRVWAPRAVCLRIHLSTPNKFCYIGVCLHTALTFHIQFDYKGYRTRWKVWGFLTRAPHPFTHRPHPPTPNPGQDQPHSPTVSPKPQAIHFSVFVFSTMQSWKHFALLFLCVNMWMIICYKNVKYVKDHSLFWKNLHLSFWR